MQPLWALFANSFDWLMAVPTAVLLLSLGVFLLYLVAGKALWTLMFLTDADLDCPLRHAALSPAGVPLFVYLGFMLLWPIVFAVPLLSGRMLMGRHAPNHLKRPEPLLNLHASDFSNARVMRPSRT